MQCCTTYTLHTLHNVIHHIRGTYWTTPWNHTHHTTHCTIHYCTAYCTKRCTERCTTYTLNACDEQEAQLNYLQFGSVRVAIGCYHTGQSANDSSVVNHSNVDSGSQCTLLLVKPDVETPLNKYIPPSREDHEVMELDREASLITEAPSTNSTTWAWQIYQFVTSLLYITLSSEPIRIVQNKLLGKLCADPSQCNSTKGQNTPILPNCLNFLINYASLISCEI